MPQNSERTGLPIDSGALHWKHPRDMTNPLPVAEPEWRQDAACLQHPAIIFFGMEDSEPASERRAREESAKTICRSCAVRHECLDYALHAREPYGIWGGLTELERRSRVRARR